MSQKFSKEAYYKAAFEYCLHHELRKDVIQLLDEMFSSTEVYSMSICYLYNYATAEELNLYQQLRSIHEYRDFWTILRTKDMSLEDAEKSLESRGICSNQIHVLLLKLEKCKDIVPEKYIYVHQLWSYCNQHTKTKKEVRMTSLEKKKKEKIESAERFIRLYLSPENPITLYALYCEYHGIDRRKMTNNIVSLQTVNPELYQAFRDVYEKENSEENIHKLFEYITPIYNRAQEIVLQYQEKGEDPDLIAYYENILFPYPLLLKIVRHYCPKEQGEILYRFHKNNLSRLNVMDNITDQIQINGVSFSREDQYQVVEWLKENGMPVSYDVFMDKLRRLAKEKQKQKHL